MRSLAALLVVAACGPSKSHPTTPPPEPVANVVPDAGMETPSESGEGSEADLLVAQGEAKRARGDGEASAQALVLFQQACDQDQVRGCEMIGETLTDWQVFDVPQDDRAAAIAYDRACHLDGARACYRYGFYILEGLIDYLVEDGQVRRTRYGDDDDVARALVRRGCDLGDSDACQLLRDDPRLR